MRRFIPLAVLVLLAACSTAETLTRNGLVNAGIDQRTAGCMAKRMVDRLSLLQLRRMAGLGKAGDSRTLDQLLYRLRSLHDPQIVSVTATSAALCVAGLAG
ncbi:hypothetical protein U1839_07285 [Sphingomonas sp. RT2P30]|uniref:hypothetical protein n=1 Tax=Parasphingomonas halimpatiens TaxID=3096162 RepID=UPI002FCB1156